MLCNNSGKFTTRFRLVTPNHSLHSLGLRCQIGSIDDSAIFSKHLCGSHISRSKAAEDQAWQGEPAKNENSNKENAKDLCALVRMKTARNAIRCNKMQLGSMFRRSASFESKRIPFPTNLCLEVDSAISTSSTRGTQISASPSWLTLMQTSSFSSFRSCRFRLLRLSCFSLLDLPLLWRALCGFVAEPDKISQHLDAFLHTRWCDLEINHV